MPSEHIYLWNSFVREKKKYSISKVDEYPETKLARSTSNSSSGIESDSGSSGFDEMDSRLTIAERIKKMGGDPVVARVPKTARNKLERHSSGFSELQKEIGYKQIFELFFLFQLSLQFSSFKFIFLSNVSRQ